VTPSLEQHAFFLPVAGEHCFCVWRAPAASPTRGVVVHVPAFGEEMNKSRRMTALSARALAGAGFGVLQLDPSGTGDSSGDFESGTFELWIEQITAGTAWARRCAAGPLWLWSLRTGSLLIGPILQSMDVSANVLLWQPVQSGAQALTHLLRLKHSADLAESGRGALDELRKRLRAGSSLEIGGYAVTSAMASYLESASLELPLSQVMRLCWLEVTAMAPPALSPAARTRTAEILSKGIEVAAEAVPGPSFWHSAEMEVAPLLVAATTMHLTRSASVAHGPGRH
jgi:exosortase A-associated hydrolase 2